MSFRQMVEVVVLLTGLSSMKNNFIAKTYFSLLEIIANLTDGMALDLIAI